MGHHTQGMNWIRRSLRFAIYARDSFDCVWCRCVFPVTEDGRGLSLDHVDGPANTPDNLVTCCHACNSSRKGTSLADWLRGRPDRRRRLAQALARPVDRALGLALDKARRAGEPFTETLRRYRGALAYHDMHHPEDLSAG